MREIHAMMSETEHYEPHSEERKQHVMKIFKKLIEIGDTNPKQMDSYINLFEAGLERAKAFTDVDSRFGIYVTEFERVMKTSRMERELKRLRWTLSK